MSLVLIYACQGNQMAQPWSPSDEQVACDAGRWGYTDPLLDFKSLSDCNTAGHRFIEQQPHVYVTWRCVADQNPPMGEVAESKPWWRFW